MKPQSDGHRLKMKLTDEGYVVAEIICPHDGNPPWDAPCAIPGPFDGCGVIGQFGEIGMECFKGEVELPTIGIEWWDDGDTSEPEMYIRPVTDAGLIP